ncbi:MAG: cold-shock protein [Rhodospirillaceae bacterium TMED8]|nr:cold-shock protein [Magnetovibrio sp.]OUT51635.1 MAG: cold-shock protein [Rhodospirillaceae bacterium TMED8]|tara:strand:- start:1676 stop:1891 length:216 start_codon:yes stop_codon:yes gene_type:complete
MHGGTVKWFNRKRGFGFIKPDGGGEDAFVHISAVKQAGLTTLLDGQKIQFELAKLENGRTAAASLLMVGAE